MKKYRWPILDVYDVHDSEALVSKCFEILRDMTLAEQLKARGIAALHARPLLIDGGLACLDSGGFVILFDSETHGIADNQCTTIIHELGHTFEFNMETFKLLVEKRSDKYIDASEDFAETFANRWLADRKRADELRLFLERHFRMSSGGHKYIDLKSLEHSQVA